MIKISLVLFSAIFVSALAVKRLPCGPDDSCPDGMICAAKPDRKRCVMPMKQGGQCKRDPFWICEEGLECLDGICTKIVPKGESCVPPFTKCEAGLVCAEKSPTRKKCIMPMPLGTPCKRDPFWRCEDGLVCKKGICQKKVAKKDESCVDPNTVCKEGLVCAEKSPTRKKCVKPMKIGKPCQRDAFWICKEGLKCVDGICVNA